MPVFTARIEASLRRPHVRIAVLVLLAAQALDAFTTQVALSSGEFIENNSIIAALLRVHPGVAVAWKLAVAMGVLALALGLRLTGRLRRCLLVTLALCSLAAPAENALRMLGVL